MPGGIRLPGLSQENSRLTRVTSPRDKMERRSNMPAFAGEKTRRLGWFCHVQNHPSYFSSDLYHAPACCPISSSVL